MAVGRIIIQSNIRFSDGVGNGINDTGYRKHGNGNRVSSSENLKYIIVIVIPESGESSIIITLLLINVTKVIIIIFQYYINFNF